MRSLQSKIKIVENKKVRGSYYHMTLAAADIARAARPGQFLTIKIEGKDQPLLRRPFGVHSVSGAKITVLYEIRGQGTRLMSKKKAGEYLDIIGPLGNGFEYTTDKGASAPAMLVAGGMGVAPLFFLAQKLGQRRSVVLLGARSKDHIVCENEFRQSGCGVDIATDDGSKGYKGRVTDLLSRSLTNNGQRPTTIYACGPAPMLKAVSRISREHNIPAQISMEEHMSCSIGACMGCVVDTHQGYKRVCKEGPVFNAQEIIF